MSENKISVSQYLENEDLLEINYVPYDVKREIVDTIIFQVTRYGEMKNIDTALLHRVSCEIFIESITNINMSIVNENNLGGYDVLCMNNALDELLYEIDEEYSRFLEILEYKLSDFHKQNTSTAAILLLLKNKLYSFGNEKLNDLRVLTENIDVKQIGDKLKEIINENLEKYKKDK